ncbi:protein kinase [Microvenator marinus]|uniref:Protein kinase n=1 Tax=Microvenator marinus TaxID=2600177 RepID=A0A5B8XRN5_9DELT|nr:serine/threonine-protein kinase [Microvenator marinus]QED27608.1 protein kinase [Microvenator marinus]
MTDDLMFEYGDTEYDDFSFATEAQPQAGLPEKGSVVDGRYRVKRRIGEGGFGWVFEVEHTMLGQSFAMKILHTRLAQDQDWHVRFRQEARATSLIGHENIVFVTDFGACPTYGYYFVMEYLDGQSLADFLERHRQLDLQSVVRFSLAASSALSAVHDLGIVHSDLKPANVMRIERPGRDVVWKFLDFGTSNLVVNSIESESVFGTPAYMPPEQAAGIEVDHRADQFALGCIIYEMLTGEIPFPTERWSDAFAEKRRKQGWTPISNYRKDIPPGVEDVIKRALALKRVERFESVSEFISEFCSAAGQKVTPVGDPLDLRVGAQRGFERSMTAPKVSIPNDAAESMVVLLQEDDSTDELASLMPRIDIVFNSVDRLRREYRRNLVGGGIYVPSDSLPPLGTPVLVNMTLLPKGLNVELEGRVVSHNLQERALPVGFGVALEKKAEVKLQDFLNKSQIAPRFEPNVLVSSVREPSAGDNLSAGEAFLLTRLPDPMRVGQIRQMLAGLPYEVDELIAELSQRGFVLLENVDRTSIKVEAIKRAPSKDRKEEVKQILELADYFERAGNFLGAMDVIRRGVEVESGRVDLRLRLARYYRDFRGNKEAARREAEAALRVEPDNKAVHTFIAGL